MSLAGDESALIKTVVEGAEKIFEHAGLGQFLAELANAVLIGNVVGISDTKKPVKAAAIQNLKLGLFISQSVERLQYEYLEHEHGIKGGPSVRAFRLRLGNAIKHWNEYIPIYDAVEISERVTHPVNLRHAVHCIKKTALQRATQRNQRFIRWVHAWIQNQAPWRDSIARLREFWAATSVWFFTPIWLADTWQRVYKVSLEHFMQGLSEGFREWRNPLPSAVPAARLSP